MPPPNPPPLSLAHILSDLSSLHVCDPAAALALVSARAKPSPPPESQNEGKDGKKGAEGGEEDADIARARELVELHYRVKEGYRRGELGRVLEEARRAVEAAVGG